MINTSIKRAFALGGFACRDDANSRAVIPLAMTDDEQLRRGAHAQHEEALFVVGVVIVEELNTILVVENGPGLLKRHLMLFEVCCGFCLIPFKLDHMYIVWTINGKSRCANGGSQSRFVSAAHTEQDIAASVAAVREIFKLLLKY